MVVCTVMHLVEMVRHGELAYTVHGKRCHLFPTFQGLFKKENMAEYLDKLFTILLLESVVE